MTTNKNVVTEVTETIEKFSTFAIPMDPEHYELVRAAAKVQGIPAAKFGRGLILAEAAKVMGCPVPVVTESKRGPKGGSKHPLAQKFGLTTAVFDKRLTYHVKAHALSGTKKEFKINSIDFSLDPFAKPVEETSVEVVESVEAKNLPDVEAT